MLFNRVVLIVFVFFSVYSGFSMEISDIRERVAQLIEEGADCEGEEFYNALCDASKKDEYSDLVEQLLRYGVNPNMIFMTSAEERYYTNTPLDCAVFSCALKNVCILLKAKADPNIPDSPFGMPLIFRAIHNGNVSLVQLLLHYGANPNVEYSTHKITPLMHAVLANCSNNSKTHCISNIISEETSIESENRERIVEVLLKHGADIHSKSKSLETAVDIALANEFPNLAEMMKNYRPAIPMLKEICLKFIKAREELFSDNLKRLPSELKEEISEDCIAKNTESKKVVSKVRRSTPKLVEMLPNGQLVFTVQPKEGENKWCIIS